MKEVRSLIILGAVVLHYFWGIALLIDPSVQSISNLRVFIHLAGNPVSAAVILLSVATLTAVAVGKHIPGLGGFLLVLPQYFVILLTAIGLCGAIVTKTIPTPQPRSALYLWTASGPSLAFAICHTLAVLDRYAGIWSRTDRSDRNPTKLGHSKVQGRLEGRC